MSGPLGILLAAPTDGQSAFRAHCASHDGNAESLIDRLRRDPDVVNDVVTGAQLGYGAWPPSYLSWLRRRGARSTRMTLDFSSCLYVRTHTPGPVWSLGEKPHSALWASRQILAGEALVGFTGLWPTVFPGLGVSHTGTDGSHRALALRLLGAEAELDVNVVDAPEDVKMRDVLRFWEAIDGEVGCDESCDAARALYEELTEEERSALQHRGPRGAENRVWRVDEDERIRRQHRRIAARRAVRGQPIGRLLMPHSPRNRDAPEIREWANGGSRSFVEWTRAFRRGLLL